MAFRGGMRCGGEQSAVHDGLHVQERLNEAWQQLIGIAFAAAEAVIIFAIAYMVSGRIRRLCRRRLRDSPMPQNAKILVENLSTVGTYLIATTVLLALWNITWSAVLAAVSAGTIIIALGFQSFLQSVVGGIFILFERPFTIGDRIRFATLGVEGVVEEIGLRSTVVRSDDGDRIVAPNALIFTNAMENRSPDRSWRTTITVSGVDVPPQEARERAMKVVGGIPRLTTTPDITVHSHLARLKRRAAPSSVPVIGGSAERLVQSAIARTTSVKISWMGSGDREVREELIRRLTLAFPAASIRVRRT